MKPDFFTFGNGSISQWDLEDLDADLSPSAQADELKEDLVQVSYGENTTLDIGWYPSFAPDGHFAVVVIRNQDWDEPAFSAECTTWSELKEAVEQAVAVAVGA